MRAARPWAVDAVRGTEAAPGIKDHDRLRAFCARRQGGDMTTIETPPVGTHRPDALGRFGRFGGRFVPETVMAALDELEAAVEDALADPAFHAERAAAHGATTAAGRRRSTSPSG